MKKYVILIWIYALSIIYMIAHVIPVIAFNADVYDDFFIRHIPFIIIVSQLSASYFMLYLECQSFV